MKDVARLAGVSTSTVSHVINKDRFVSEAITAKVEAAIKELNYAPSALARSLKLNQTGLARRPVPIRYLEKGRIW
ncbi:TPA: LacI family DNA-binding transcriptional regulator [Escherichia coli]|nr:LacI family DNA-binding transcriptional regulator [Escherichia coli]